MTAAGRARADFTRFIGIDLGGGRGKTTAVARLETRVVGEPGRLVVVEAKIRHGHRGTGAADAGVHGDAHFRDEVLLDYLARWVDPRTVVAVNAPLTLPPCVRCQLACPGIGACEVPVVQWMRRWGPTLRPRGRTQDPGKPVVTPYTQRATELLLAAAGLQPRESLGQGNGPLTARATYLRRALSPRLRLHENLLEVDPNATLTRRFGADAVWRAHQGEQSRVWEERNRMLHAMSADIVFDYVWPELVVRNVHVFQAVICAVSAFAWAQDAWPAGAAAFGRSGPPAPRASASPEVLADAADALGDLWLVDGWIWVPPPPPGRGG